MKKQPTIYEKDGYTLRLARAEETDAYYVQNYHPLDVEVARLTGSHTNCAREEVTNFFKESVTSEECYLFTNFRIRIFHSADCGKGIGFWAVQRTRRNLYERKSL